jgi:hypothetical protein
MPAPKELCHGFTPGKMAPVHSWRVASIKQLLILVRSEKDVGKDKLSQRGIQGDFSGCSEGNTNDF